MKSIYFGIVAMLTLIACAPNAPAAGSVHPLSEILAKGPEFAGATPDSVTVRIDTRIPVVWAAAYGTTTAYGSLATDTDMAGGAHQNHHPSLTGLKSDTFYHIRFQGVGPDGTLYASDDFIFKTPAAGANYPSQPTKPQGKNIALASAGTRVKGVSSNYGGVDLNSVYGTNKAIDGDLNTEWSSNGDGDNSWIELDLSKDYKINVIGFRTRTMGTSAQIARFQVITDKGEKLGPFDLPDAKSVYYFPVSVTARTLRLEVLKSGGGNTGATQIGVYSVE